MQKSEEKEHEAITNFRKYLRIPSVHPNVNYEECVKFLTELGNGLELPVKVIYVDVDKPVVIITFEGKNPELPSVLLNSHMDVVPVFPEKWTHDPFGAVKDENGNIYARGAQDMKCVGIQYIETIRKYLQQGLKFKRTIHMSFVPEEEVGGNKGMADFVHMYEFKQLNVGFSLDEGIASETDEFLLFYAERSIWQLRIICPGTTGHGSILHTNTAAEKIQHIINRFLEYREKEKENLQTKSSSLTLGDVTTINLTMLSGGVQANVLPSELSATFDIRLAIDVDHDQFDDMIKTWCSEAGEDVRCEYSAKNPKMGLTMLDESNPWWIAFKSECDKMGLKLKCSVFPGGTDSRYLRKVGIPAIGFSPIYNTPVLLHDHNEYLNENIFLRGLDIYYNIIKNVASV